MLTKKAKLIMVHLCFLLLTAQIVFAGSKTTAPPNGSRLQLGQSTSDHAFLPDLERRSCRYFQEQINPHTGLVLDQTRPERLVGLAPIKTS